MLDRHERIYTIPHFRRTCRPFVGSAINQAVAEVTRGFDFIMGSAADDRMNEAVRRLAANELTDEGLFACLARVRHGTQIAAKTTSACRRIHIVSEQVMYEDEPDDLIAYERSLRLQARGVVSSIQGTFKGKGRYLSELLDEPYEPTATPRQHRALLICADDT